MPFALLLLNWGVCTAFLLLLLKLGCEVGVPACERLHEIEGGHAVAAELGRRLDAGALVAIGGRSGNVSSCVFVCECIGRN